MLRPVITRLKMAWQKTLQIRNTQYCPLKKCVEASCISLCTRKHQKLEAYSNDKFTHRWPNEKKNCSRQQLLLLNAIARRTTTCSNTDQLPTVPETTSNLKLTSYKLLSRFHRQTCHNQAARHSNRTLFIHAPHANWNLPAQAQDQQKKANS